MRDRRELLSGQAVGSRGHQRRIGPGRLPAVPIGIRFPTVRGPRSPLLAVALVLSVVLVPPAFGKTDTVTRGNVTAMLSYEQSGIGFRDVRVRVVRDGVQVVNERGPGFRPCRSGCDFWPAFARVNRSSVFLRNLDSDPEPEVLGEFYTGGANCCLASRIYDFDPARAAYGRIDREWRTSAHRGARDIDRDGSAELESADARFRGLFGCAACTPQPLRVFKLRNGELVDVTRRFRGLITRDLRGLIDLIPPGSRRTAGCSRRTRRRHGGALPARAGTGGAPRTSARARAW